ncbi:MAG TPA: M23 family metallopeptidase [Candidatus Limnocylindrales bacterium]|nr:M23 family metallopeptidase [Candidatus Limnocylindrales bacterium]
MRIYRFLRCFFVVSVMGITVLFGEIQNLSFFPSPAWSAGQFIFPLNCELGKTCFITNYMDDDPAPGSVKDWNCGSMTYDGHNGTDFVIEGWEAMDRGVDVLAADSGVVTEAVDGYYDHCQRNCPYENSNHVFIHHANGLRTVYHHMKKGSILVKTGDRVKKGQKIGEVGSSGDSDTPHLHFIVTDSAINLINPYAGPCSSNRSVSYWENQEPYQGGAFKVVKTVLTNQIPQNGSIPPSGNKFYATDSYVTFWVRVLNVQAGDVSEWRWYTPKGELYSSCRINHDRSYAYSYWYCYTTIAGYPAARKFGVWTVHYLYNGTVMERATFTLEPLPSNG